ncbi:MAG: VOC family protein [Acidobacteria bacterium]|nr:VOC family protein [Acidobacteriota bacterium]
MEHIVEKLVQDFETGGITRRQLIQSLALAITAAAATSTADAATAGDPAFKAVAVNHISYRVADYAKTRDFYVDLLGMKVRHDNGKECALVFGPNDTVLIPRNYPTGTPVVDHIGYTIAHFDREKVEAELKRRGLNPKADGDNSFHVHDPNGFDVQICSKTMKP